MHIRDLAGKKICILGYGLEGQAMVKALEEYAPDCSIVIADRSEEVRSKKYEVRAGEEYMSNLESFDAIIKSPGIPMNSELKAQSSKLTSSTQIFLDSIADTGATVIGVTGSKGKSTTASLIHHILSAHSSSLIAHSFLVGNIGKPAIAHIADAKKGTIFVVEMSSYQLMDLTVSPHIAVVTSFFPEHLDYHGSLEAYLEAKKHIARFQKQGDHIYYNARFPACKEIAEESAGHKHPFSDIDSPVLIEETKLKGAHNLSNIAAAYLVAEQLGVAQEDAVDAIKSFTPLPHRLQSLGVIDGIEWVNDSISTAPESAVAALDALRDKVTTVMLGGQDRGYDFSPLIDRLKISNVQTVILLPDSGKKIGEMIEEAKLSIRCYQVQNMKEAVEKAKQNTRSSKLQPSSASGGLRPAGTAHSSPIVLLSPASPSYGHFKNFEDRGAQFERYVRSA